MYSLEILLIKKLHLLYVEEAHIRQSHVGNDRQRNEGQRDEMIALCMDAELARRIQKLALVF